MKQKAHFRYYGLFLLLTVAAFGGVLTSPFMLDDPFLIEHNPRVQAWTIQNVQNDFTQPYYPDQSGTYYRPLQFDYLRAIHSLCGLTPLPYHVINLMTQAGNGWLVYALALILGASPPAALAAGAALTIHPGVVHEIMACSETDLIGFFLLMLSLYLLLQQGGFTLLAGMAVSMIGFFWKESHLVLPFLLAVCMQRKEVRKLISYWPCLLLFFFWIPYGMTRSIAVRTNPPLEHLGLFMTRIFPEAFGHYVRIFLFPWNLHTWPALPIPSRFWEIEVGFLAILMGGIAWKGNRWARWGSLWVLITLLPKIPAMMMNNVMMDHWVYCSLPGFLIPASAEAASLYDRLRPARRRFMALFGAGMGLFWIGLAQGNIARRGSDEKNLSWELHFQHPTFVEYRLSVLLLQTGRPGAALPHIETLITDFPENPDFGNVYALTLWRTGHRKKAVRTLEQLLLQHPDYRPARENLNHMRWEFAIITDPRLDNRNPLQ